MFTDISLCLKIKSEWQIFVWNSQDIRELFFHYCNFHFKQCFLTYPSTCPHDGLSLSHSRWDIDFFKKLNHPFTLRSVWVLRYILIHMLALHINRNTKLCVILQMFLLVNMEHDCMKIIYNTVSRRISIACIVTTQTITFIYNFIYNK